MPSANEKNAILARWATTLREFRDGSAIFDERGGVTRTFAGIEAETHALEAELDGLPAGLIFAVQLGNSPSWPALILAALRRGLILLPLGSHVEKTELAALLNTLQVGAMAELRGEEVHIRRLAFPTGPRFDGPPPDLLKLTSGTTAAPRAIRFRAAQLMADADQICATMGFGPADRNYGVIPFSHSYGFSNLLTPLLCRGVPLVASHDRMPRAIADGLRHARATVFPGMPVFYQALAGLTGEIDLPDLRLCISAGAPLTPAVGRAFTERFHRKIHTFYGSSECGGITYDASDADYESGFVGREMQGVAHTSGDHLKVCGPAVGDAYWPTPDPNALGGGTFVTGDIVEKRERGYYITGRALDVINIAGRKLNPLEVEARIGEMPGVREVVVFGVGSESRSEEAIACIVPAPSLDRLALIRQCRETLSTWQVPRDFWFVESFPVNERGKTSRRELARQYENR